MFVFAKEKMKYPVVGTEDRKHFIMVNCTPEMVETFASENKLTIGKEGYYKVHHSDSPTLFNYALASLPRRLDPVLGENQHPYENFRSMYKFFYINGKRDLIVKGVYVGTEGEENPFKEASTDPETGFKCLDDVKLHG